jgi:hypothetical protein
MFGAAHHALLRPSTQPAAAVDGSFVDEDPFVGKRHFAEAGAAAALASMR